MARHQTARFQIVMTAAFRARLAAAAEWEGASSGEIARRGIAAELERIEKARRRTATQPDIPGARPMADVLNEGQS